MRVGHLLSSSWLVVRPTRGSGPRPKTGAAAWVPSVWKAGTTPQRARRGPTPRPAQQKPSRAPRATGAETDRPPRRSLVSRGHPEPTARGTIFVATNRSAPKKSTWVRRKTEELNECYEQGESDPQKIDECDNFADPQTKYLVGKVWARHLHYTHNLDDEPPPVAAKSSKKVKLDDE